MNPFEIVEAMERTAADLMPEWTSDVIEAGWPRCLTPWVPWDGLEWEDWLSEFEGELDRGGYLGGTMFALLIREGDPTAQLAMALGVRALHHEIEERAVKLLTYSKIRAGKNCMRWCAAVCLGVLGHKARLAVPRLLSRLAKERAACVRIAIAWALTRVDPRAARKAFQLTVQFDPESTVRFIAGRELGRDCTPSTNSRGVCRDVSEVEWTRDSASCAILGVRNSG